MKIGNAAVAPVICPAGACQAANPTRPPTCRPSKPIVHASRSPERTVFINRAARPLCFVSAILQHRFDEQIGGETLKHTSRGRKKTFRIRADLGFQRRPCPASAPLKTHKLFQCQCRPPPSPIANPGLALTGKAPAQPPASRSAGQTCASTCPKRTAIAGILRKAEAPLKMVIVP